MPVHFKLDKRFEVKNKLTVDGKDYNSLEELPAELRAKIEQAIARGVTCTSTSTPTATITINGKTYASLDDAPLWLRTVVRGLTGMAPPNGSPRARDPREVTSAPSPALGAPRAEPIVSKTMVVVALVSAALLFLLARLF